MQLSNAPVNSLTLEVCEEMVAALRSLEAEPSVRGVLLGSVFGNWKEETLASVAGPASDSGGSRL